MTPAYDNRPRHRQEGGSGRPPASAVHVTFYLDPQAKQQLNPTLLDEDAEKQADALRGTKINSTQIRRFFGDVKNLSLRLEQGRPWAQIEPLFRMLRSKAEYAKGTKKIPDEFSAFIGDNVERVKDQQDFKAFVLYFEAVLGFAYGKGLVKE